MAFVRSDYLSISQKQEYSMHRRVLAVQIGQVPSILGKFHIVEAPAQDITIQVIVGSDILRSRNADIMFSQERLVIFDEERNQLAVPLVRPENEEVYKNLATSSVQRQGANAENAAKLADSTFSIPSRHHWTARSRCLRAVSRFSTYD